MRRLRHYLGHAMISAGIALMPDGRAKTELEACLRAWVQLVQERVKRAKIGTA